MKVFLKSILLALLAVPVQTFAFQYVPSEQRSAFSDRKKSILDANDMRASYHNFGQGGRVNGNLRDEFPFEFPKNSRREYMLFIMAVVGGEVINQAPAPTTNRFPIVTFGNLQSAPDGSSWSLNPIPGYSANGSRELARSDRGPNSTLGNTWPATWPDKLYDGGDGWPNSWNGYFGRDQFSADLEFYYRMSDDRHTRYLNSQSSRFRPDSTDVTRGGLGLLLDSRVMAWTQVSISNVHFNIYEMTNDASFDHDKIAFGLWMADLVATTSTNDVPEFDAIRSIAYITDGNRDQYPPFFEGPVGEMAIKFLETPGNALDGIDNDGDSFAYDARATNFFPANGANDNLYRHLLQANGGFFRDLIQVDSFIPQFSAANFAAKTYAPGDKIIEIDENYNRIVRTYVAGQQFKTRGMPAFEMNSSTMAGLVEDFLPTTDAKFGVHFDLVDNDFDGLIDENQPNHVQKTTFNNAGLPVTQAVRAINYYKFAVGDTIKPGYLVSNRELRQRLANDAAFRNAIQSRFNGQLKNLITAAPMIDEARDDRMDNDNDWTTIDDVGIVGDADVASPGRGDGYPSSGAGTSLPGEPSIDKTDVSETDLIGVSRTSIIRAGVLRTDLVTTNWTSYLIPGTFQLTGTNGEDADIFVTSSLFPLRQGQTERFAVAISAVQTKGSAKKDDRDANNRAIDFATKAYEADYQFATAPLPPNVTAVVGDRKVVLYWDTEAETSFDRYVNKISGNGFDFEGYRVYRATDVSLSGSKTITDALGVPQFLRPLAIYDRVNSYSGFHPVPVRGTQYNMGPNTGLRYMYVDTTVYNGKEYFYAVTSFDFGWTPAGIAPSESPIATSRESDGTVTLGPNVVRVRPAKSVAGTVDAQNPNATRVTGGATGTVRVDVLDPAKVKSGNTYRITFRDTVISGGGGNRPDTLKTRDFSLFNISANPIDTLLFRSVLFNGQAIPNIITEGFRLTVTNELRLGLDTSKTFWKPKASETVELHKNQVVPNRTNYNPSDYYIVFKNTNDYGSTFNTAALTIGSTTYQPYPSATFPKTNFKVFRRQDNTEVPYVFREDPATTTNANRGYFSADTLRSLGNLNYLSDNIVLIESYAGYTNVDTWRIRMLGRIVGTGRAARGVSRNPVEGDTLFISSYKPFTRDDRFEFTMQQAQAGFVDAEKKKADLGKIKVVPNPYVSSSPFERPITNSSNQQQRELHFTNMPVPSTLRIFTVSGVLVKEIKIEENDQRLHGGTFIWNMLTKDNLEISYGVYIYQVDAPGAGKKVDKFAVIK